MESVLIKTKVRAPLERCFTLSTRVELVQKTLRMRLVDGVTAGHVVAGSRVVWRGWKFGWKTEHHTLITQYAAPHEGHVDDPAAEFDGQRVAWFEDSQERGRFAEFRHMHLFRERDGLTEMEDRVDFRLPFGVLGRGVARWLMAPYVRRLARERFALIRELAEGDGWRAWVREE